MEVMNKKWDGKQTEIAERTVLDMWTELYPLSEHDEEQPFRDMLTVATALQCAVSDSSANALSHDQACRLSRAWHGSHKQPGAASHDEESINKFMQSVVTAAYERDYK